MVEKLDLWTFGHRSSATLLIGIWCDTRKKYSPIFPDAAKVSLASCRPPMTPFLHWKTPSPLDKFFIFRDRSSSRTLKDHVLNGQSHKNLPDKNWIKVIPSRQPAVYVLLCLNSPCDIPLRTGDTLPHTVCNDRFDAFHILQRMRHKWWHRCRRFRR